MAHPLLTLPPRALIDEAVRPTRAEVDLSAIEHNVRVVRERAGVPVYGVVKADAYGHGAVPVARAMVRAGAAGLCVALVEEGLELRAAGVTAPVLVMSGVYRDGVEHAVRAGLTPVLFDPSQLAWLERLPEALGLARLHLKVDTGMARLGITASELPRVAQALARSQRVRVEGLMSHFADADGDDDAFTLAQLARFEAARAVVQQAGLAPSVQHIANSAGAFRFPQARMSFVRAGIALYGVAPFPYDYTSGGALEPAFRLRTEVLALRELSAGEPVGYGCRWRCSGRTLIATLPVGYADGFFRRLSSDAQVLVRGVRASVVGTVAMDMCMVDVTALSRRHGVEVGDEVVLLGTQTGPGGTDTIRAEELAMRVGTIPYEVLTAVSRRVPRAYVGAR